MRKKGEAILDCSIYQKKKVTPKGSNWHFQIFAVFIFNVWFKIFQRCYLKIILVYLNWVELHLLIRSIISIATHLTLIYSWFNFMVSESFGLIRIWHYFLKTKEYTFISSLILKTCDRFLFRPFHSDAPQNFFLPYSIFSMMSKGERLGVRVRRFEVEVKIRRLGVSGED